MPTLAVETVRTGDVTLVEALVTTERPHRVRIESRLDGPVWPPRRDGRPLDGWDDRGIATTVDAGTTAFGFATPAPPREPAAELVDADPVAEPELPDGLSAWFERVEARLERAERIASADDLPSATRAVASAGGLVAVETLAADLARDRRVLARLSVRPEGLADRLESVDLDLAALRRLAQTASRRS